jgi:pimeloyl-ACP methyl ester carboxylesterase
MIAAAAALVAGCALGKFSRLEGNLQSFAGTSALTGTIPHRASKRARIIVTVFEDRDGVPEFVNASRLLEDDFFLFLVPPGRTYYLLAFDDRDGNMAYMPGEPVGACGHPQPRALKVDATQKSMRCRITLIKRGTIPPAFAAALAQGQMVQRHQVPLVAGEIAALDDARFSQKYGEMGLWAPFDYLKEVGAGVYFLEPYDPRKIPILFVGGAGGYPQEWRYLVEHLDRARYQPWFYLYPSGARLETASRALGMFVKSLRKRYSFKTLYVTAHSMGGLVARDFILRDRRDARSDSVKLFISFSTPWSGHEAAQLGTKYAPATIPSWIDLQTESEFQKGIFARSLPAAVRYYLFFGHKGRPGLLTGESDGTVSLVSMLRIEAQNEALRTFGFDEDHTSILQSPAVAEAFSEVLAAESAGSGLVETSPDRRVVEVQGTQRLEEIFSNR